jgi:hypothetical protein
MRDAFIGRLCTALVAAGAVAAVIILTATPSRAVPGFARQTGLACEACHTVYPELTPFGRNFKLGAYVFSNTPKVSDINEKRETTLSIGAIPPFSIMFQGSFSSLGKALPDAALVDGNGNSIDNSQKNVVQFPQQISLFYTGEIADNFGAFIQLSWSPDVNVIAIDNTDLRFADNANIFSRNVLYGLTLNNNPTSQDVWNSTPAWGYPFLTSPVTPGRNSGNAPNLLDGNLAASAAGAGAYVFVDNHLYVEIAGYRSAKTNFGSNPNDSLSPGTTINGTAPYWRVGWEQDWSRNSLFVGTYGMHARSHPGSPDGVAPGGGFHGPTDSATDVALDTQYQWIGEDHILSLYGTWIHESFSTADRARAANLDNHLDTLRLTANYFYKRRYGGSVQLFSTSGSSDPTLYPTGTVGVPGTAQETDGAGSRNGSPRTTGAIFEADYLPWLNTKIGLQYTLFTKFNGNSTNYDGLGRNASDNNTLFLFLWTAF